MTEEQQEQEENFFNRGLLLIESLNTSNLSSQDTIAIEQLSLKLGRSVYYALDSVKYRLVRQTQQAVEAQTYENLDSLFCITYDCRIYSRVNLHRTELELILSNSTLWLLNMNVLYYLTTIQQPPPPL